MNDLTWNAFLNTLTQENIKETAEYFSHKKLLLSKLRNETHQQVLLK